MNSNRLLTAVVAAIAAIAILAPSAAAQTHVVVVVPTPGNPVQSGNDLLAAYNGILAPSSSNRYLVLAEPGIYDLEDQNLVMRSWISLAGSGVDSTSIYANGNPNAQTIFRGAIEGADNAELRDLTVRSFATTGRDYLVPIYLSGASPRISNVRTQAFGAPEYCGGIYGQGSDAYVQDVEVRSACPGDAFGIAFDGSSSTPSILRADIIASSSSSTEAATGVLIQQGAVPVIRDSSIRGSGGSQAVGLELGSTMGFGSGTAQIVDTTISGRSGSTRSSGIATEFGGTIDVIKNSAIEGSSGSGSQYGIYHESGSSLTVESGQIAGGTATVISFGGFPDVRVGSSRLDGGPVSGLVTCAGVYDENFTFSASTCP